MQLNVIERSIFYEFKSISCVIHGFISHTKGDCCFPYVYVGFRDAWNLFIASTTFPRALNVVLGFSDDAFSWISDMSLADPSRDRRAFLGNGCTNFVSPPLGPAWRVTWLFFPNSFISSDIFLCLVLFKFYFTTRLLFDVCLLTAWRHLFLCSGKVGKFESRTTRAVFLVGHAHEYGDKVF